MSETSELTDCSICTNTFDELEYEPKFLRCAHYFFKKCMEKLENHNNLKCPICRKKTTVPTGGVSTLPCNFYVEKLKAIIAGVKLDYRTKLLQQITAVQKLKDEYNLKLDDQQEHISS